MEERKREREREREREGERERERERAKERLKIFSKTTIYFGRKTSIIIDGYLDR